MSHSHIRFRPSLPIALAIILVATAALCLPMLSASGLAHAEGQRVQPAWGMLSATRDIASASGISPFATCFTRDSLDAWLVPHLFEQAYLRKPPGMPWAIALFGALLGESNAAARAVSACALVLMALLSAWTAARWFAPTRREQGSIALVAGLAACLLPAWYWYPPLARSAEIESLNHLCTFIASVALMELILAPRHASAISRTILTLRSPRTHAWTLVLALGIAGVLLTKGPASMPVLVGVAVASAIARARGVAGPLSWRLPVATGLVLGASVFGAWLLGAKLALARSNEVAITQEVGEFLFTPAKLLAIVALPLVGLVTALPHSLALLWCLRWGASPGVDPSARRRACVAKAIALGVLLALLIYTLAGVSNNRYVLPAATLLPLCLGAWWALTPCPRWRDVAGWGIALFVLAASASVYAEHRRATRTSGEADGVRLGQVLEGPAELWGDELLDMRPEIAMRATKVAMSRGHTITPRWTPLVLSPTSFPPVPPRGSYLLVRSDHRAKVRELDVYTRAGVGLGTDPAFTLVFTGKAHNFEYHVFQRLR